MLIKRMSIVFPLPQERATTKRQPQIRAVLGFALGLLGMVALGFMPIIATLAALH